LIGKARIALAELDVGDIRVHLFIFADLTVPTQEGKGESPDVI
jgi:hypothetical protein